MRDDLEIPEFLREAFEDEPEALAPAREVMGEFSRLLEPRPAAGRARLLAAVEPMPLRYAPFYERLARLWDLPVTDVEFLLARAQDPASWRKPGLPGLRVVDIDGGPSLREARVTLVRFARGMLFPAHFHPGPEALLVLEGRYQDQTGRVVGAGDLHEMPAGSEHWFRVGREEPCVAASIQFGLEFTGTLMKVLTRLFG